MIPAGHPRAESLRIRESLIRGYDGGLVAKAGLLAHGRGEAFDYILGEETREFARKAVRAAAAAILLSSRPVLSVNGNAAALCPEAMLGLARESGAALEVNLFYGDEARRGRVAEALAGAGAGAVLGADPEFRTRLPGLDSERGAVDRRGMAEADLVVVPLEDGDRVRALREAGKTVVALDLNPLSRTARDADITIVDNVVRAMPLLAGRCRDMAGLDRTSLRRTLDGYDNRAILSEAVLHLEGHLRERAACA